MSKMSPLTEDSVGAYVVGFIKGGRHPAAKHKLTVLPMGLDALVRL